MIVCGTKKDNLYDLFEGTLDECKKYCKSVIPSEWDSVNICRDNGVIEKRFIKDGQLVKARQR